MQEIKRIADQLKRAYEGEALELSQEEDWPPVSDTSETARKKA